MPAPRAERAYRVIEGWLAGVRTVTVRRVANAAKLNHDARRAMRLAAMRGPNTKTLRGRGRPHQAHAPASPSGPSTKALDRLQGFAMEWFQDGVIAMEAA